MTSKRKLNRLVEQAERQLAAVENRESAALPIGQQLKLGAAATVTVAAATRLKSSRRADSATERIWRTAEATAAAEVAAARALRDGRLTTAAAARIARKAGR